MIFIALGGFFGAMARYGLSRFIQSIIKTPYPIATFFINSFGSFLIGFIVGQGYSTSVHLFAVIGFLGAFTTFSTFSFEVIQLFERNEGKMALLHLISSVLLGILFAVIGFQFSV